MSRDWDEYGTHDPDAPWNRERPLAFNKKKNTKVNCKGVPGRKHVPVYATKYFGNRTVWYNYMKCDNCGKVLRYGWTR